MAWNPSERERYRGWLVLQEKSPHTVRAYLGHVSSFAAEVGAGEVSREAVLRFREGLTRRGRKPTSVNAALCAVNSYLKYINKPECRVRQVKAQRRVYREPARTLNREEYKRLVAAAHRLGDARIALIMQTLCSAGLRVSELRFVTVEAAARGEAAVRCKRKTRVVFLVPKLCRALLAYAKKQKITSGPIFVTRGGKPLDRSNIWRRMKTLCVSAEVAPTKVFPHNLRRLFACSFWTQEKDIVKLADLLGHSSVNTTRIYLQTDGEDHRRKMEKMRLVC
ncbi:MAG: tyrosine-type recombinase/integrase [Clostridia bacterium]|nr:tyrosine-type recombinase/integrase [Clostridia bacterium]